MPTKQQQSNTNTIINPSSTATNPSIMVMGSPGGAANSAPIPGGVNNGSAPGGGSVLSAVEELVYEIKENLRLKARPAPHQSSSSSSATSVHHHHHSSRSARPSPYHIPCRSWSDSTTSSASCDTHHHHHPHHHQFNTRQQQQQQQQHSSYHRFATRSKAGAPTSTASLTGDEDDVEPSPLDDPYEMLQTLLKSNNLVKEAVRRLQLNYDATIGEDSSTSISATSSSKHDRMYFYDSDDEAAGVRSPVIRMCELEL